MLLISRGEAEANRQKAEQLGLTLPVVLQRSWEISRSYAMFAMPSAYLVDEHGFIGADVATGVEPILALAAGAPVLGHGTAAGGGNGRKGAVLES